MKKAYHENGYGHKVLEYSSLYVIKFFTMGRWIVSAGGFDD